MFNTRDISLTLMYEILISVESVFTSIAAAEWNFFCRTTGRSNRASDECEKSLKRGEKKMQISVRGRIYSFANEINSRLSKWSHLRASSNLQLYYISLSHAIRSITTAGIIISPANIIYMTCVEMCSAQFPPKLLIIMVAIPRANYLTAQFLRRFVIISSG